MHKELYKSYRIAKPSHLEMINDDHCIIMQKLNVEDLTGVNTPNIPHRNRKDHKLDFNINPTIGLICPNIFYLGGIKKHFR